MIIRTTLQADSPAKAAEVFSALLAIEKGFTSRIILDGATYLVVASDGQAVRFAPKEHA